MPYMQQLAPACSSAHDVATFRACDYSTPDPHDCLCRLQTGIAPLTDVIRGDFLNMPFADNTFDAAYAIEATCHAPKVSCQQLFCCQTIKACNIRNAFRSMYCKLHVHATRCHQQGGPRPAAILPMRFLPALTILATGTVDVALNFPGCAAAFPGISGCHCAADAMPHVFSN